MPPVESAPSLSVAVAPSAAAKAPPASVIDESGDEFFDVFESDADFPLPPSPRLSASSSASSSSVSSSGFGRELRLSTPITLNESGMSSNPHP